MGRTRQFSYPGVPEGPGYYVYELWAGETCLYVGRVGNSGPGSMLRRLASHRSAKPWFGEVTDIVVSAFASHEEVAAEEPRRIFELQPLHNRTYAAKCKRGHARPPMVNGERAQCLECQVELQHSPKYKAWLAEYNQRPEVKRRNAEATRRWHAQPEVHERRLEYWRARNATPEAKAKQQEREKRRGNYYAERNARPEVKEYKKRWLQQRRRRPSPGQAALF